MTEEKYTGSFEEQMDNLQDVIEKEMNETAEEVAAHVEAVKETVELETEPVIEILEDAAQVEV